MAQHGYRMSTYSNASSAVQGRTNTMQQNQASSQVSTTTVLNTLHGCFKEGTPYSLESSTSLVTNTWVTGSSTGPDGRYGGTVDPELARRAWEHARRRAEDACIVLGYVSAEDKRQMCEEMLMYFTAHYINLRHLYSLHSPQPSRSACQEHSTQHWTH